MPRLFIAGGDFLNEVCLIDKEKIHYLKDVLRLKEGDSLYLLDGKGNEYLCRITRLTRNEIICKIEQKKQGFFEGIFLAVACAIPKKNIFDEIVDKLTQLGVDEIFPIITERTQKDLSTKSVNLRQARWKRISLAASQQAQRLKLPKIGEVKGFKDFFSQALDYELKLIPTLSCETITLKKVLEENKTSKRILVLVGPEGDFSSKEVAMAKEKGFIPVSLGSFVLRVETAAVAISSFIRLYYEKY